MYREKLEQLATCRKDILNLRNQVYQLYDDAVNMLNTYKKYMLREEEDAFYGLINQVTLIKQNVEQVDKLEDLLIKLATNTTN